MVSLRSVGTSPTLPWPLVEVVRGAQHFPTVIEQSQRDTHLHPAQRAHVHIRVRQGHHAPVGKEHQRRKLFWGIQGDRLIGSLL